MTFFKVFFLVVSCDLYHVPVVLFVFLSLWSSKSHGIIQADKNAKQEMNFALISGYRSKNLWKTNKDTEMMEYSDNKTKY